MVVDEVARRCGITAWKRKDAAMQALDSSRGIVFVKPTTFMNLSGTPVRLIASWYRVPPEGVLVISDDMDLPFGKLRMRRSGGHGGHNGLRSIIATTGESFPRIRIGVGRPEYDSIDHVLGPFNEAERTILPEIIVAAADGVGFWIGGDDEAAMRFVNSYSRSEPD
jgi:peptidyl-tRNA hydrolase, PTH1 family